jgi:hypothetical protein
VANKNFFAVNRSLFKNSMWKSEKFTKGQAWIDLFGNANHSPGYFEKNGQRITLERGQSGRSIETLADDWKWSRNKVKRFLKRLEDDNMIGHKPNHLTSIITICNYDRFQSSINDDEPSNGQSSELPSEPSGEPQTRRKKTTNNKKELTNKSENKFSDDCLEMKLSKYLYKVLLKSDENNPEPNYQKWCLDFDYTMRIDKRSASDIQKVINFAHNPINSTDKFSWIPNLRSPKKIREHFTSIILQSSEHVPITETITHPSHREL